MGLLGRVTAGAFLGGLAEDMKENREYARTKSEKIQDYLYQRGLERRQKVQEERNKMQAAVDFLTREGLDERKTKALLSQNPVELLNLAAIARDFKNKAGRLTPTILNQAVTIGEGFEGVEATASELIAAAMPDFVKGADLKKPEDERTLLQKLFRGATNEEIMYDAYSRDILGGDATGADIAASINAPMIKRSTGSDVSTSYVGLKQTDRTDVLKGQNMMLDEYGDLLQDKIDSLTDKAGELEQSGADASEINAVTTVIEQLERIKDLETNKEQLEAMIQNPNIGIDIAKKFYVQFPEIFNDILFIDPSFVPLISGEETSTENE